MCSYSYSYSYWIEKLTFLLSADKNFRAAEELGQEVREISKEAKELRQEMGEDLRKLRELASVRSVTLELELIGHDRV